MNTCDVLVAVGARFDDRVTGQALRLRARSDRRPPRRRPGRDLEAARRGHPGRRPARTGARGARARGRTAPRRGRARARGLARPDRATWREEFPLRYGNGGDVAQAPARRRDAPGADRRRATSIVTTGVGQHQMWAMQYVLSERPRSFITSGGLGTMGYGIPAAIGAKAARPEATVVCVDGDGCFQMTAQELATAVLDDLPIVVVLVNNGYLGMVTQWQDMFFDGRRSHVHLTHAGARLRQARGGLRRRRAWSSRARTSSSRALRRRSRCGRTVVVDCRVDPAEHCFPMIPPGAAALDMIEYTELRRGGEGVVKHTLSVARRGQARARSTRITTMFARRGFNIDSLAVGPTERPGVSCITLRVDCYAALARADREADPQARQRAPRDRARRRRGGRARAAARPRRSAARAARRARDDGRGARRRALARRRP